MENRNSFDLQKHIEQGVEAIVAETLKATLKNPRIIPTTVWSGLHRERLPTRTP
jgi:hypothetical protein